jgi:hypothetical protein
VRGPRPRVDAEEAALVYRLRRVALTCWSVNFGCSDDLVVDLCGAQPWGQSACRGDGSSLSPPPCVVVVLECRP